MKSTDFIHSCWILKWDENKIFQKETTLSISNSSYRTYVGTNFVGKRPISIATHLPITVAIGREDITTRRDKQTEGQTIIFWYISGVFHPFANRGLCLVVGWWWYYQGSKISHFWKYSGTFYYYQDTVWEFFTEAFQFFKVTNFFLSHVIFLLIKKIWNIYRRN